MSASAETKAMDSAKDISQDHKTSSTDANKSASSSKKTVDAANPKNNPHQDEPSATSDESKAGKANDETSDNNSEETGDKKAPKTSDEKNSDGFIPGEPLEKNHVDSTAKARKERHELEEKEGKGHTEHGKKGHGADAHEHEGIAAKLKGALHHEKKTA